MVLNGIMPPRLENLLLSKISLESGAIYRSPQERSVEIMICLEGNAQVTDVARGEMTLVKRGTAIIVPSAVNQYTMRGKATLYKASVPLSRIKSTWNPKRLE